MSPSNQTKHKKKRKTKLPADTQADLRAPAVAVSADGPAVLIHHVFGCHKRKEPASTGLSQFAPGVSPDLEATQATMCGPRWACPVEGHDDHTLAQCQEFWEATSCMERRGMMMRSSCFMCLGRDQGCSNSSCAIIQEVPPDTVCQGCARNSRSNRPPVSIVCSRLPFHEKPPARDMIAVMEKFVPGFKATNFGGTLGVNVLRAERAIAAKQAQEPDARNLAYNTQTGTTKKVEAKDRILTTSNQCACYIMQQLNIAGERSLTFYDSGANNNLVEYELAQDANFQLLSSNLVLFKRAGGGFARTDRGQFSAILGPVLFKRAGGGFARTDRGQFSAILGPDVNGDYHNLEFQAVDRITGEFPFFMLREAITEANAAICEGHVYPPEIGRTHVRLLIGIRNMHLAPLLRLVLPSGLCLYGSKF